MSLCRTEQVPELPDSEPELSDLSDDSEFTPDQRHLLDEEDDRWNPPQHLPTLPEVLVTTHGFNMEPRTSPKRVHTDQREPAEESIQENGDVLTRSTPPAKVVAEAICLMVEDPYFDTPLSSPSPEEAPAEDSTWTLSPIFQTPSLLLNDETLTSNSPAPGMWEPQVFISFSHMLKKCHLFSKIPSVENHRLLFLNEPPNPSSWL